MEMATHVNPGQVERPAAGDMQKWAGVVAVTVALALGTTLLAGGFSGSRQAKQIAASAPASVQNHPVGTMQPAHGALAEDVPGYSVAAPKSSTHGALADDGVAGQTFRSARSARPAPITHGLLP